jgi:hypothetical protein
MANNQNNGFREFIFWSMTLSTITVIVFCDVMNFSDAAVLSYTGTTLISIVCAILFADWWRVKGSASSIYKWITVLLFALAFNDAIQFIARYSYIYHHDTYEHVIDSIWWQYRSIPKLVALIYLLSFAVWQRWGRASTYSDGIRQDMANGFNVLEARILQGEVRFAGHSHEGLILDARLIVKPVEDVKL